MLPGRAWPSVLVVTVAAVVGSACILEAEGFTGGDGKTPGDSGADGASSTSSSGASSGSNPALDGSSSGTATSSGDGGDPPGTQPNLLINGDFELGCAGWTPSFGFVAEATVAHGGARSCKFCMDTNFEATLTRSTKLAGKKGQTYIAEIWYQAASSVQSLEAAGYVGSSLALSGVQDVGAPTPGPPLDGSWQRTTTLMSLDNSDSAQIELELHLQQTGNPAAQGNVICVFVDDATLRLAPQL